MYDFSCGLPLCVEHRYEAGEADDFGLRHGFQ